MVRVLLTQSVYGDFSTLSMHHVSMHHVGVSLTLLRNPVSRLAICVANLHRANSRSQIREVVLKCMKLFVTIYKNEINEIDELSESCVGER